MERLRHRLTEALAVLRDVAAGDLGDVGTDELDGAMADAMSLCSCADVIAAKVGARWESAGLWAMRGSRSAAADLSRRAGVAKVTANRVLRRGRHSRETPVIDEAYTSGSLSSDQVDRLLGARTPERAELFERDEAMLVELAQEQSWHGFVTACTYWGKRADAALGIDDGDAPDNDQPSVTIKPDAGNMAKLEALLSQAGMAEVKTALDRLAAELAAADKRAASRVTRSKRQLMADAMVEMARRAMAMPEGANKPRPLVMVVTGEDAMRHTCELWNGVVIGPRELVELLADADIQTVRFGDDHQPESVSSKRRFTSTLRRDDHLLDEPDIESVIQGIDHRPVAESPQRTFGGALRRAIQVRDRHCQHHSGCDAPISECDVDHVTPWTLGGRTTLLNGRLLCRFHNRIQPQRCTPPPPRPVGPDDCHPDTGPLHRHQTAPPPHAA